MQNRSLTATSYGHRRTRSWIFGVHNTCEYGLRRLPSKHALLAIYP